MSAPESVGAEVEVTVVLKITPSDTWSTQATVAEIREQAKRAAMGRLSRAWTELNDVTTVRPPEVTQIRIVNRP